MQTFGVGQLMESMLVNDCPYGFGAPGGTTKVVLDHVEFQAVGRVEDHRGPPVLLFPDDLRNRLGSSDPAIVAR